jgi:hypothetical protein
MQSEIAGHPVQVKFWLNGRIATITNGTPYPAGIAIVRSVRILKQPSGLTGNKINCCRFCISW